jgi:predicted dehydrogenase
MVENKLRIGIIGVGDYARHVAVPHLRATGRAEVVAISRRTPDLLKLTQEILGVDQAYTDWREMLERAELDAVLVTTGHSAHCEPTLAALERGLHVLVEKPMALTSADAQAMAAAAQAADRVLMVGYNSRCMGRWRAAKEALQAGAIGAVRQVSLAYCIDMCYWWDPQPYEDLVDSLLSRVDPGERPLAEEFYSTQGWRSRPDEMGGGTFLDMGTHAVDAMLWMAGAGPAQVAGFTESVGLPVDVFLSASGRLANGVLFSCDYGSGVSCEGRSFFGDGRLTVWGDEGLLKADWTGFNPTNAQITIERGTETTSVEAHEPDTNTAAAFVATLLDGAPNFCPGEEAARTVALTEALYRSAETGEIIRLAGEWGGAT